MEKRFIDFRSDTVTKPSAGMREAMYEAEVGDDVLGDDPTVKKLEERICSMLGTESALFVSSGTQANLLSIMSHCQRGDEYIAGQSAHCYNHEGGGAAVLGSIQPQPIEFKSDGSLDLDEVAAKIKPDDFHFARTRLLCLENTQDGKALSFDYMKDASIFSRERGLSIHLDGARLFNAAASISRPASEIAALFDTVSVCLSKGLGAPVGSLMCGKKENVDTARRWRKVLGGGMRQAGIIAAAGLYAIENNIERLDEDHQNLQLLRKNLKRLKSLKLFLHRQICFLSNCSGIRPLLPGPL
ncbi:MAG: low-specificity L-threonine aldolase [Spirochaetales bacterium]|nr:low-specificity L-threonine aldolase [Spirochaetales bacterium]